LSLLPSIAYLLETPFAASSRSVAVGSKYYKTQILRYSVSQS